MIVGEFKCVFLWVHTGRHLASNSKLTSYKAGVIALSFDDCNLMKFGNEHFVTQLLPTIQVDCIQIKHISHARAHSNTSQ